MNEIESMVNDIKERYRKTQGDADENQTQVTQEVEDEQAKKKKEEKKDEVKEDDAQRKANEAEA